MPTDYSRMYMQSYYIQDHSMSPNHASPWRLIVNSNDLVKEGIDCSKEDERNAKQDSKYLQPRWCPLRLVSYPKAKTAMFAQEWNNGATSKGRTGEISNYNEDVATKIGFSTSTWLEQDMADNCLSPLAQIMADVLFIIALRQFWSSGLFFWQTRFTKKQGGHRS